MSTEYRRQEHLFKIIMVVKGLENLEKSGNEISVREKLENLEKLGNFTERAQNSFSHIFFGNNVFSDWKHPLRISKL